MKKIFIIILLPLFLLTFSCSKEENAEPLQRVRIAFLNNDLHQLAAYVALNNGYYTKQGLQVEVAGIFKAGPEEMSAFSAGEIDAGYVGLAPAVIATVNGVADVMLLAQVNNEGSSIVVPSESSLTASSLDSADKKFLQLAGKKIAIPGKGTMQDFLIKRAIEKWKPEPAPSDIVIKPPEMLPTLVNGDVDAFISWEPYPTMAEKDGRGKVIINSGEIWENHPCCVLVGNRKFIEDDYDRAARIIKAHVEATEFIKQNPDRAVIIGMSYTGLDESTVRKAIGKIKYVYYPEPEGYKDFLSFLIKFGYIKQTDPESFLKRFFDEKLWKGF
ncbi:MAG: ABC transporter substrate-binding protein [Candidatus Schekmanbacteria bacterium]|nr:ABC transporter substrate-binding protein [Candidatus Schekmanbacteria bacterium]